LSIVKESIMLYILKHNLKKIADDYCRTFQHSFRKNPNLDI